MAIPFVVIELLLTEVSGLDVYRHDDKTAPPPNPAHGTQSKEQPTLWSYYSERGIHYDRDLVEDANNTVEVLLIFAGLFSAVVTAFISQTYPMLQRDPKDIQTSIYLQLRNPGTSTPMDDPFVAPSYAVRVNCFLFAGLFTSMFVALLGILVKQWTRSYQRQLAGVSSPHLRARIRHFRFNGAKRWQLARIVGLLSIFMHLALFISAVGIIDLLIATAPTVGWVALSVFILGVVFFLTTAVLPLFVLDAPFRSPLSKVLFGMKMYAGRLHLIEYLRNFRRRNTDTIQLYPMAKEEGLEDHIQQSQGGESSENSIVRTQIHLDLDIICHLLSTADKSTERWLLDLCFEKLPNLRLLEQNDPHTFHSRDIILEVYNFLVKGCITTNQSNGVDLNPDRLPRARILCKFLAWYLSLPHTEAEKEKLTRNLEKGGDPTVFAKLLAESAPSAQNAQSEKNRSVIDGITALGCIEHFKQSGPDNACSICEKEVSALTEVDPTTKPPDDRDEKKVNGITSLLIKRTDCLCTKTESPERTTSNCVAAREALRDAFQSCNPVEKDRRLWLQVLAEKEARASTSLKDAWFVPLQSILNELQVTNGYTFNQVTISPSIGTPAI
ncbi:hypothetical protein M408DRAFT_78763 [Serendipita vermifera MAFF 305830]|uniref:DUF6535 domain-containing protein n=1 Tax=Serendipita vermifera MAFF 305830 TaxID=933852 RepID=A0A0C2W8B6_SERVB|nr:hypothetical protein M408DRAFT_78763 [Serendipita vermifera MAFF 305830]